MGTLNPMAENPYAGIADACNSGWQGTLPSKPIDLVQSMKDMFRMEQEREVEDRRRMFEWGEKMQKRRKENPRRYDAELQAALEIFGRQGDPVNPVIAHPKQVQRYEARVEELFKTPQEFRAGG
jgi:hypothetical protein